LKAVEKNEENKGNNGRYQPPKKENKKPITKEKARQELS